MKATMKAKKGCKPLTTGRFNTRRELEREVCRLRRMTFGSMEAIAEECDVSQTVVFKILRHHETVSRRQRYAEKAL